MALPQESVSKVKDIQSFPIILRRPESGSLMEITSFTPVNGLGGAVIEREEETDNYDFTSST
jgi:hypothetical protein